MIKNIIKKFIPNSMLMRIRQFRTLNQRREFAALSVAETFSKIYRDKLWGQKEERFDSGPGSSGKAAEMYIDYVSWFIREYGIVSVVDLGCGDFRIGKHIAAVATKYTGIDVVPELVAHHTKNFSTETIDFKCLDVTYEKPPIGDICLVRQVLQHLSNDEISSVIKNFKNYRYVLITEHFPLIGKGFSANKEKSHGPDARAEHNSAVALDKPPFLLHGIQEVLAVEINDIHQGDTIRTFLYCPQIQSDATHF
jgi:SAM-dependent methyltransferase